MIPNLSAVILDRAARPLIEPEISGIDAELASQEDNDVIRHLSPAARKPAIPAVVLQQHREAQSGRSTPRGREVLDPHPAGSRTRSAHQLQPQPAPCPAIIPASLNPDHRPIGAGDSTVTNTPIRRKSRQQG